VKFTLSQTFSFDAAHTLDRGEASRRVHGHTYFAEVAMRGHVAEPTGMLVDLSELRNVCDGVRDELDHRLLDEVPDLGPATLENLAAFIFRRISRYPCFVSVRVWRADGGACLVEGDS
jgi:6-pyruvoyltetrahydropterin/6-carboxytetrahydropterin synthase